MEVYDDVSQSTTYDDLGDGGPEDGGVYDDTESSVGGMEYDDLNAPIVEVPCDKLHDYTIAEYMDLKKEGGLAKLIKSAWQKRYCVVHRGIMYMYESPKDKKNKEAFRIKGFQFKARGDITKEAKRKDRCFEVRNANKVYEFCAADKNAMGKWSNVFGGSVVSGSIGSQETYDDLEGGPGGTTYDDTTHQQGNDIYEDTTADQNYNDTSISAQGGDIYEDTEAPAPAPPMQQRRPSAREELPKPPANRPAVPTPSVIPAPPMSGRPPPALPPREEIGSASGSIGRPPILPPSPGVNHLQRGLPEPPGSDSQQSPSLPPLPSNDDLQLPGDFGDSKDDYINMYQGMWDCDPEEDNELMFKRGEIIHILSREYNNYGWWVAENVMEDIGLVPVSYIMKAYDI